MKILWLPHGPLYRGRSRSDHLIERLAAKHDISVVSFRAHDRAHVWRYAADLLTHRSRDARFSREVATWRLPRANAVNGRILRAVLKRELARGGYDVFVAAAAPYVTGDPRLRELRDYVPIVCDYLDGGDWATKWPYTEFERAYVRAADAAVCVSRGLLRQASLLNGNSHYVPNGVELARYDEFRRGHSVEACKRSMGIDPDKFVVSIIGMTCSPSLYFADAIVNLARKGKKVVLLLVGESPLLGRIARRFAGHRDALRICGPVPYGEVMRYFLASDVGLNAVDDIPYYHYQSPLKIFEYGAMRKPVLVSPKLDEVEHTALPFVRCCEPTAESVQNAIEALMEAPPAFADSMTKALEKFEWSRIADDFDAVLQGVRRSAGITVKHSSFGSVEPSRSFAARDPTGLAR